MNFNKIVALITGGASGLGKATVELILEKGGKVITVDTFKTNSSFSSEESDKNNILINTDVTKEEDVYKCFELAYQKFDEVNLVVNCAGIGIAEKIIGKEELHSTAIFKKVIDVNLFGTFNIIKAASGKMQHNSTDENGHRGVIINTASIAAFDGQIGQSAYSASKGAIVSMTLPISRELARYGIRVCTIAPGLFETPMLKGLPEKAYKNLIETTLLPRRLGKPKEYAKLVQSIYENDMLNGETIRLDGSIRLAPK